MIEIYNGKGGKLAYNFEDISDFQPYLDQIKSDAIRHFTKEWLMTMPKYVFHIPASTSGKYHPASELGEGGLKRHLINVTKVAIHLCDMYGDLTDEEKDCVIAAAMLHDMLKCGWQEDYEKSPNTKFEHPRLAANAIMDTENPQIKQTAKTMIANCIITHMGRWNKPPKRDSDKAELPTPMSKTQILLHTADFIASRKDITIGTTTIKTKSGTRSAACKLAEQVLIDNGIEESEASTVLQAVGYALLDTELYPDETKESFIKKKNLENAKLALALHNAEKYNGEVIDADTILADVIDKADTHVTGIGKELLEMYINSNFMQRETIEKMFYHLFDKEFCSYIADCIVYTSPAVGEITEKS